MNGIIKSLFFLGNQFGKIIKWKYESVWKYKIISSWDKKVTTRHRNLQLLATEVYKVEHVSVPNTMNDTLYETRNRPGFSTGTIKTTRYGSKKYLSYVQKYWKYSLKVWKSQNMRTCLSKKSNFGIPVFVHIRPAFQLHTICLMFYFYFTFYFVGAILPYIYNFRYWFLAWFQYEYMDFLPLTRLSVLSWLLATFKKS